MSDIWAGLSPPYRTIVADPPWHYAKTNADRSGEGYKGRKLLPYTSMTLDEIKALPVAEVADIDARVGRVAKPREVGRMNWPHDHRIIRLQARLLDHTGHVTRGMSRDDARINLDEINRLRALNGWKLLDMTGRWRRGR